MTQADSTRQSALLVIDAQADLFAEPQAVYDGPAVLARINGVIEQARRADVPVLFVQDDEVAPVGSEGWEVHPALEVKASDLHVQKAYADAFYKTCLLEELQRRGVQRLVVVGCTTDACIEMTCRGAVSLSFDVVLVSDGHTTKDNRFLSAAQSIEYYNLVLDGFGAEDSIGKDEHEVTLKPSSSDLFTATA